MSKFAEAEAEAAIERMTDFPGGMTAEAEATLALARAVMAATEQLKRLNEIVYYKR